MPTPATATGSNAPKNDPRAARRRRMLDALRAMDSQDRSIMVMYAHDELTDREIAAALDLPPALVTRRRRKLLAELRDARNARPA